VPWLAQWLLGLGISVALAANVAHGLGHGLIGAAAVGAWRAVALVGFYGLLMMINRGTQETMGNASPETEQAAARMPHALTGSGRRGVRRRRLRPVACHRFALHARNSTWDSRAPSWCARTSPRLQQARPEPGTCKRPWQT
jgi:hypothetical protein